jgi:hypothetical protein
VSFFRTTTGIALLSLAFAAVGVIVVAAYAPRHAPVVPPAVLVACSALLCGVAGVRSRSGGLPRNVAGPTLLAATIAAGFLELVFAYDGTRGAPLVLLTIALVLVALDLPLLLGSTVASAAAIAE